MKRALLAVAVVACGNSASPLDRTGKATPTKPIDAGTAVVAPAAMSDRWAATLVIGGSELHDFGVTFTSPGAASLVVGNQTLPLIDVAYAADQIHFTFQKPGSNEVYKLDRAGDKAKGVGVLSGQQFPIRMIKLHADEPLRSALVRPQTPAGPFPYDSRELVVPAPDGGKLAGTLAIPKGAGPFPCVLLLSGSGQQDRDETIYGHKPFLIIADRLARAGIATYRFDDRGTGKTEGRVGTLDTEVADAAAVLDALAKQKEVDPARLGVLGHSTGGMVAPNAALKHPVAFVVSLAGVAVSGIDLVPLQQEIRLRAAHVPEAAIKDQLDLQRKVSEAAVKDPKSVRALLADVVRPKLQQALGHAPTDAEIDNAIAKPVADATQPWVVSFFRSDPRVAWKQLSIPVLYLGGDKDTQVPADVMIQTLTTSVGKPELLATHKLPGLNHLFQHATSGLEDEYIDIDESFAPEALDALTTWLVATTKAR